MIGYTLWRNGRKRKGNRVESRDEKRLKCNYGAFGRGRREESVDRARRVEHRGLWTINGNRKTSGENGCPSL